MKSNRWCLLQFMNGTICKRSVSYYNTDKNSNTNRWVFARECSLCYHIYMYIWTGVGKIGSRENYEIFLPNEESHAQESQPVLSQLVFRVQRYECKTQIFHLPIQQTRYTTTVVRELRFKLCQRNVQSLKAAPCTTNPWRCLFFYAFTFQ